MRQDPRTTMEIHVDTACDMILHSYQSSDDKTAESLLDIVEATIKDTYIATILDALNVGGFTEAEDALAMWQAEQV